MSGKMYTGRTSDGSDMQEVQGMFVNPNNPEEWSNQPYKITNPYKGLSPLELYPQKPFVCKGLHQYKKQVTNNLVEWICQCGKQLK